MRRKMPLFQTCLLLSVFLAVHVSCQLRWPNSASPITAQVGRPRTVDGAQPQCIDNHRRCKSWAKDGGCVINWGFMATQCRKICGFCDIQGQTALYNHEKKLKTRLTSDYDVTTRPMKNNTDTIDVAMSFSLLHLMNVDEAKQTVTVQGYLKLKWQDPRLEWKPDEHGEISRLSLASSAIWHPSIMVVNTGNSEKAFLLQGNPTPIMVTSEGVAIWTPRVEATSLCNFDVKFFPVDRHDCSLTFGPWMQDGNLVNMTIWEVDDDGDIVNPFLLPNQKWQVTTKLRADDDFYSPCCSEPWPVIHIDLQITRHAPMIGAAFTTPLVYVIITLLLCFLLPIRSVIRFLFSAGDCVILIVLLLHISGAMPEASSSSPVIVQITAALILESLMVMMWCGMLYHLSSPRCRVRLAGLSSVMKTLHIRVPEMGSRVDDGSYTRLEEPQQDLVEMFFGTDSSSAQPKASNGNPTTAQTGNGNGSAHEADQTTSSNATSLPKTTREKLPESCNRHMIILLNRIGLVIFALIFLVQFLVVLLL